MKRKSLRLAPKAPASAWPVRRRLGGLYSPELLESRIAPATFVVTSLADDGTDGALLTLREAIDLADATVAADTITFKKGLTGTITLNGTQLTISESVSIKGPGIDLLTISGNNASRIFNITDGTDAIKTVSISGLTLIDGNAAAGGGGIFDRESLALKNVVIASCTASSSGGGGVFAATDGRLSVTGCIITGNHSDNGVGGMVLVADLGITLTKTTISFNDATGQTGGVSLRNNGTTRDVLVDSVLIVGNTQGEGGAIRFDGPAEKKAVLKNSIVTGNSNTGTGAGGGVYLQSGNLVVDKCVFSNNTAVRGGAIGDKGSDSLLIKSSRFLNNRATDAAALGGGALYLKGIGPVSITGSVFAGNHSASDGGAIAALGGSTDLNITGSTFMGNAADDDGGAIAVPGQLRATIKTSTFSGNTATGDGGALYAGHAAFLAITGGSFSENHGNRGGAVAIAGTANDAVHLVVTGTLFQANQAADDGGAIRSNSDGGVLIKSARFIANIAASDGGAVSLATPTVGAGTRTVLGSLFRANVAADDAGGMDVFEATTVTSCLFIGNTAGHVGGDGGGLRLFSGVSIITKSVITGNFASTGGGIFNNATASTIDAATKVTGNAADTDPNKSGI